MKKFLFPAGVAIMLLIASAAVAGTTTRYTAVDVEIPSVFNIDWTVEESSIELTALNAITPAEYAMGYKDAIPGGIINTTANDIYDVSVMASSDFFLGGSSVKPTNELLVDIDGSGYTPLNGVGELTLINAHASEISANKTLAYKILFFSDDSPGKYNTTLTYTIKAHI
jgi:hypothetical protein